MSLSAPQSHNRTWWALAQLAFGLLLHLTGANLMNTDLYSVAFLLVQGGASLLVLAGFYAWLDLGGAERGAAGGDEAAAAAARPAHAWLALPCRWVGKNSLLIYILACSGVVADFLGWFWWGARNQNLGAYLWPGTHWGTCSQNETSQGALCNDPAVLVWTLAYIAMFGVLAWWLNRKGIFVKI